MICHKTWSFINSPASTDDAICKGTSRNCTDNGLVMHLAGADEETKYMLKHFAKEGGVVPMLQMDSDAPEQCR